MAPPASVWVDCGRVCPRVCVTEPSWSLSLGAPWDTPWACRDVLCPLTAKGTGLHQRALALPAVSGDIEERLCPWGVCPLCAVGQPWQPWLCLAGLGGQELCSGDAWLGCASGCRLSAVAYGMLRDRP